MRPFKFFFLLSMGLLFFFAIGRFLLVALLGAAFLSFVFAIGARATRFFRDLDWDGQPVRRYGRRMKPVWKNGLLLDYPVRSENPIRAERVIEVQ